MIVGTVEEAFSGRHDNISWYSFISQVASFAHEDSAMFSDSPLDRASMVWLILAYLFHTLGELCLSPVGLSYVSKLVPPRMIAFMFGMWYLALSLIHI